MKTLAELRTELDLGMKVYPSANHDVQVFFEEGWYIFDRTYETPDEVPELHGKSVCIGMEDDLSGGVIFSDCYISFDALLADWPIIASQSVWGTVKTPERMEYDRLSQEKVNRENEAMLQKMHQDTMRRRIEGVDPFDELFNMEKPQ